MLAQLRKEWNFLWGKNWLNNSIGLTARQHRKKNVETQKDTKKSKKLDLGNLRHPFVDKEWSNQTIWLKRLSQKWYLLFTYSQ